MKKKWLLLLLIILNTNHLNAESVFDEKIFSNEMHLTNKLIEEDILFLKKNEIENKNPYDIPKKYQNLISIDSKSAPIKTIHSKYIIKGNNKFFKQILVYDKKIPINYNGDFYYEFDLKNSGIYHIPITFFTKENKYLTVYRTVEKLAVPEVVKKYPKYKKELIDFYNSKLGELAKDNFDNYITRAEFAYLLSVIKNQANFKNDYNEYWANPYINLAVEKKWLSLYPDNKFYPAKTISRFEYIQALLKLDENYNFSDSKNWVYNFTDKAKAHQIIFSTNVSNLFSPITWAEFVIETKNSSLILNTFKNNDLEKNTIDLDTPTNTKKKILLVLNENIFKHKNPELYIDGLQDFIITNQESYLLEGQLHPPGNIKLNNIDLVTDEQGYFSKVLDLEEGLNAFNISTQKEICSMNIFLIKTPDSLENHWIKQTYAKLAFLKIIKKDSEFNPKTELTRKKLAVILKNIIDLKVMNTSSNVILKNNQEEYLDKIAISEIVNKKIMTLDQDDQFNPNKTLTRAEALSAVIRATELDITENTQSLHYWDISKNHWASSYIQTAIKHDIISTKQKYFYPDRIINEAELIALISKLPHIREMIYKTFHL